MNFPEFTTLIHSFSQSVIHPCGRLTCNRTRDGKRLENDTVVSRLVEANADESQSAVDLGWRGANRVANYGQVIISVGSDYRRRFLAKHDFESSCVV
jgi:hypothetical protein